ncbi:Uncharacterized protein Rs2_12437 [Raphanus sativus]|nr:Uncharacterized protein Rs2_12437 [Raphanus sativus]
MAMVVLASSLHPPPLPLRFRPPPDPPPCLPFPMSFEALCPPLSLSARPPDLPPFSPSLVTFEALFPPEPPDPPDASCRLSVLLDVDTPFTLFERTLTWLLQLNMSMEGFHYPVAFLREAVRRPNISPLWSEVDVQASLVWLMLISAYVAVFVTSEVTRYDVSSPCGVKLC